MKAMIETKELKEIEGSLLTGITVGIGSQVLIFQSGASLLVQCPYVCGRLGETLRAGHGESVCTAVLLFDFLNCRVEGIGLEEDGTLFLRLGDSGILKVVPDRNGLESYVVTTRFGISPVMVA